MIMDTYEKKYKDSLEKARYILHTVETAGCAMHKDLLEEIFPELRESEDEKKVKGFIDTLRKVSCFAGNEYLGVEIADCIGWFIDWLEKQKEQKPVEWSEADDAHLHSLITHLEQWIERHPNTTGADIQDENVSWLKSLKNRGNFPKSNTNSPSWSEEEEQMFGNILNYYSLIEVPTDGNGISKERYVAFIKSLRNRPKSSDTWKPSEEQMKALNAILCEGELTYTNQGQILIDLYNDLKKL